MFVKLRVEIPFNYAHLSNSISEDQFSTDEPILRLQRNVFLSPGAELQIEHPEVVRLLYCEAMENVIEGLYPIDIASKYGLSLERYMCICARFPLRYDVPEQPNYVDHLAVSQNSSFTRFQIAFS